MAQRTTFVELVPLAQKPHRMQLTRENILELICPHLRQHYLEHCPVHGEAGWKHTGKWRAHLWGRYENGKQGYDVLVRTNDLRFQCTCTDSPALCPHAFHLLLRFVEHPQAFTEANHAPDWALPAIEKWDKKPPTPLQPWKKRIPARRMQDMLKGLDLLELWLHDLLRVGIHTLETNSDIILHIARRMVDHKLGGIGRRLRRWYNYLGEEDWPHILLDEIGSLYLAIQAMRKLDDLPEGLPEDLLAIMGVSIRRNDLLAHPDRICGRYTCTGVVVRTEETNMRSIWTWLVNAEKLEFALLLDFEVDRAPSERFTAATGSVYEMELVAYPSALPQRMLVRRSFPVDLPEGVQRLPTGYPTLTAFAEAHARAIATVPWRSPTPALLDEVVPVFHEGRFFLVDKEGKSLPLIAEEERGWELCALAGGLPLTLFGLWEGRALRPVSVWMEGVWYSFQW